MGVTEFAYIYRGQHTAAIATLLTKVKSVKDGRTLARLIRAVTPATVKLLAMTTLPVSVRMDTRGTSCCCCCCCSSVVVDDDQ